MDTNGRLSGYVGSRVPDTPELIGLPATAREAEALADPKATLAQAIRRVRGSRRPIRGEDLYPAIAQRNPSTNSGRSRSFADFERRLKVDWLTLVVLTLQKDFSEMVLTVPASRGFEEEQGALVTCRP